MILQVLGSSSSGNGYILTDNEGQSLIIELGVKVCYMQQALKFKRSGIVGAIVTHEHGDHAKYIGDYAASGIEIYATAGTFRGSKLPIDHHRANVLHYFKKYQIGPYTIMPFDVQHDVNEPCGFFIFHPEMGNMVFVTDTTYCKYAFEGINNILIEANYCEKMIEGEKMAFLRRRIIKSHMSLQNCILTLKRWDTSKLNKLVLIHLSDRNSESAVFKDRIQKELGLNVDIAKPGLTIELNKSSFIL